MSEITFYDLPSRDPCACWSLNPWKTRMCLNYKGLPYRTEWVEYPDVAPKFKEFGILPNNPPNMSYTIPTITLASGEHIMDSEPIARKLEALQPEPALQLDHPLHEEMKTAVGKALGALRPFLLPRVPRYILTEKSEPYFQETRKERFGMSLDELEAKEAGEKAWTNATPYLKEVAAKLHEDESGPFLLGKQVSYADFVFVGFILFCKRTSEKLDDDLFNRIVEIDPVFQKQYDACRPWLERNSY